MQRDYNYEYEYDSRYCYHSSKVLKNKLNITDADELAEVERKIRLVNISKGNQFCRVEFIDDQMEEIFEKLRKENYLKGIDNKQQLAKRLAYYLGEINAIHPFREGNGRCQRLFIQLLSESLGYKLDFMEISEDEMLEASVKAFDLDYMMLEELIYKAMS